MAPMTSKSCRGSTRYAAGRACSPTPPGPTTSPRKWLDNSVDEALGGHCKSITVTVYDDGSVSVEDDGRGMPADIHAETGLSGIELILTRLHAGAKFSREQYRYAGGLHGVGVSVVNALSQKLAVTVKRSGQRYTMHFADGHRAYEGRKPRKPAPAEVTGTVAKNETGTCIRFWPDGGYFDKAEFNLKDLRGVLRSKALLCAGLSVTLVDQRKPNDPKTETWQYADGLPQYLAEQLDGYETLIDEPLRDPGRRTQRLCARLCDPVDPAGSGAASGKLRQSGADHPRRHPHQRASRRAGQRASRVCRVPQATAQGHQAHPG